MILTTYFKNKLAEVAVSGDEYTAPTVYLSLCTAVTDAAAGTVTELAGGSFARQLAGYGAATAGVCTLGSNVVFDTSDSTGTVTHVAAFDAATSGNCLFTDTLNASKNITDVDTFTIASGGGAFGIKGEDE